MLLNFIFTPDEYCHRVVKNGQISNDSLICRKDSHCVENANYYYFKMQLFHASAGKYYSAQFNI